MVRGNVFVAEDKRRLKAVALKKRIGVPYLTAICTVLKTSPSFVSNICTGMRMRHIRFFQ
jgi:hypothetical protein